MGALTRRARPAALVALALSVVLAGCSSVAVSPTDVPTTTGTASTPTAPPVTTPGKTAPGLTTPAVTTAAAATARYGQITKVLVIAEENETYSAVLGSGKAPYLDAVAKKYATATKMDAGYPVGCPSLAAYLLMTSGDRHTVCDNRSPDKHRIRANNIFRQMATSGRQWRNYAESMPAPCTRRNTGNFLVRHAPAPYYVSEDARCKKWMLPLGTLTSGALADDIAAGTLPEFGFITPDQCNDMHGGPKCPGSSLIRTGDQWLKRWMAKITTGPDYRAGRLIVFITWDEGDTRTNHIPLLVVGPGVSKKVITRPITQCHMLRTVQDILRVAPLGCAAKATSLARDLGLPPA